MWCFISGLHSLFAHMNEGGVGSGQGDTLGDMGADWNCSLLEGYGMAKWFFALQQDPDFTGSNLGSASSPSPINRHEILQTIVWIQTKRWLGKGQFLSFSCCFWGPVVDFRLKQKSAISCLIKPLSLLSRWWAQCLSLVTILGMRRWGTLGYRCGQRERGRSGERQLEHVKESTATEKYHGKILQKFHQH